ncbi:MAG: DUF1634 domain-containing protein [Armatimonadetes bacterium]|nr:DUF1634 domain-containing protein [Armatimonadota bacterium]MBS1702060.1 DUF1634 domain-containing protein [Armatimonadota bacterium]MBS1728100.1 DUF1634 domain-containing protein [Armatimonadota bacterium]
MPRDTEGSMQNVVSVVLRGGVAAAALVGGIGWIGFLAAHGHDPESFSKFSPSPERYRAVGEILGGASHFDFLSIMLVGVLLLVLTPVLRVAVSLIGFVKEKDRLYVLITSIVLTTLLASLIGGMLRYQ